MPDLQATIASLAQAFAAELIVALRSVSLAEILGERASGASKRPLAKKPAPMPASNAGARARGVNADAIVAILRNHKGGLRAEHLRRELGAAKHTFNYHVGKALSAKQITRRGAKRATTYFVR